MKVFPCEHRETERESKKENGSLARNVPFGMRAVSSSSIHPFQGKLLSKDRRYLRCMAFLLLRATPGDINSVHYLLGLVAELRRGEPALGIISGPHRSSEGNSTGVPKGGWLKRNSPAEAVAPARAEAIERKKASGGGGGGAGRGQARQSEEGPNCFSMIATRLSNSSHCAFTIFAQPRSPAFPYLSLFLP